MDQVKTGKFIAECRRQKNLTQMQLAEMLNITDKAVSKWERGIAMPDTSIMLPLCYILGINVNELLSGEKISMENEKKNEQLLLDMASELERKNKTIWSSMWVIMSVSTVLLVAGLLVAVLVIPAGVWQFVSLVGITALFMVPCLYAVKLEASVGHYRCKECGEEIVPTYSEVMKAMHKGFTRKLICPRCNKRTWCKKVIKK